MNVLQNIVEFYKTVVVLFGSVSLIITTLRIVAVFVSPYELQNHALDVLDDINRSFSRNTAEFDEHWCWWSGKDEDVQFQMVHCFTCGGYVVSQTKSLSPKIVCNCEKNKKRVLETDYYSDDDSVFLCDYDY